MLYLFITYTIHKISDKNFRIILVREFVERHDQNRQQYEVNIQNMLSLRFKYIPVAIACISNNKYPTKRYVAYYKRGIRKELRNVCKNCKVTLCTKVLCFENYHKLQ